ncbi:hypothetical protein EV360DRAFT_79408 [Lentinula raphanica]|nr:hypothetical protein EV360DRAFT_79408 [Lentinula raphanica]
MRAIAHACLFIQLIVGFSAVAVYSLPAPVDDHGGHKSTLAPMKVHAPVGSHGAHMCHRLPVQHHIGRHVLMRRTDPIRFEASVTIRDSPRNELANNQNQKRADAVKNALELSYGILEVYMCPPDPDATTEPVPRYIAFSATITQVITASDGSEHHYSYEVIPNALVDADTGQAMWNQPL